MFDIAIDKVLHSGERRFHLQLQWRSAHRRVVLLGGSGAGKTLTLKAMAGLLQPDAGHVRLAGRTLFDAEQGINLTPQQRQVGYLFQDYALFPHMTVRQNIVFVLQRGWRNPRARERLPEVEQWLEALHITQLADQMPYQLSGGQRQRVALARALAGRPGALLLDEPFSALDPALRQALRSELDDLQRRLQLPMVLITHDPEDARQLGEHIIHLQDGRVLREEFAEVAPSASALSDRVPDFREASDVRLPLAPAATP